MHVDEVKFWKLELHECSVNLSQRQCDRRASSRSSMSGASASKGFRMQFQVSATGMKNSVSLPLRWLKH